MAKSVAVAGHGVVGVRGANRVMRGLLLGSTALMGVSIARPAVAQNATPAPVGFETGGLTGTTTAGTVTLKASDTVTAGGTTYVTTARQTQMARIEATGNTTASQAESTLGLAAGAFQAAIGTSTVLTNFGLLTKNVTLAAGAYTFGWSYVAQDYAPFNDGAFFSLTGNSTSQLNILASNFSSAQPDTLLVGAYGSTPWRLFQFNIATAGTYKLGFGDFNAKDMAVNPILYIDDGVGGLTGGGVVIPAAPPPTPNIVGPSTIADVLAGTVNPVFAGGTITAASGNGASQALASNLTVTNANGTFAVDGGVTLTASGTIANAAGASGGITKSGAGTLVLNGTNSFTGGTTVTGGTLSLGGTGSAGEVFVKGGELTLTTTTAVSGTIHTIDPTVNFAATGTYADPISLEVAAGNQAVDPTILNNTSGGAITLAGKIAEGTGFTNQYVTFAGGSGSTTTLTNAANSWTGVTRVNGGATLVGTTETISGGSIIDNGTLRYEQAIAGTVGQNISGTGSLAVVANVAAGNALTFSGALTNTGGVALASGTVVLTGSLNPGNTVAVNQSAGTTLDNRGMIAANAGSPTGTVFLGAGGTVLNGGSGSTGASITGDYSAIYDTGGALDVTNAGVVYANAGYGIVAQGGNGANPTSLTLSNTGKVVGTANAVVANDTTTSNSIINSGVIQTGSYNAGTGAITASVTGSAITVRAATTVVNNADGAIIGGTGSSSADDAGITSTGGLLKVTNAGAIVGGYAGVQAASAQVTNQTGGVIVGGLNGVSANNAATSVTNAGLIGSGSYTAATYAGTAASQYAVNLGAAGGTVFNDTTGEIRGGAGSGIFASGGTLKVVNLGTIRGSETNYQANGVFQDGIANSGGAVNVFNAGLITSATRGTGGGGPTYSAIVGVGQNNLITNAYNGTLTGGNDGSFGVAVQLQGASTFNNYGIANSSNGIALRQFSNAATTINLFAGSTTGAIITGAAADAVTLYTGTGTSYTGATYNAATGVTTAGITAGANLYTASTAGTHAAASVGTINLGGGANTVTLRGAGDNGSGNGVGGTLTLGTGNTGLGTIAKLDTGVWTITGDATNNGITQINAGVGTPAGILIFNNTSNLAAPISVNGAIIRATGTGGFGTGTITTVDPTVQYGSTMTYGNDIVLASAAPTTDPTILQTFGTGITATLTGTISQSGRAAQPLVFSSIAADGTPNTGTFILTNANNNYAGLTTISTGTTVVEQNTGTALGSGGVQINSGAVLQLTASTPQSPFGFHPIEAGTISGTGTLRFSVTGTGQGFSFGNLGNVNVALGSGALIDVQSGTVNGSASGQGIWTNNLADLNITSGAIFDAVEGAIYVDALTGTGTLRGGFPGANNGVRVGVDNGTGTFGGTIVDSTNAGSQLILIKQGTGTQTLTGALGYTGGTTVSGGTLQLQNRTLPGGAVSVASGATLEYNLTTGGDGFGRYFQDGIVLTGAGTVAITGARNLSWRSTMQMSAGGLLRVGNGASFTASSDNQAVNTWVNNLGNLQVDSGGAFATSEALARFGRLEGAGTVSVSNFGSLTLGVADATGGTFSGVIQNQGGAGTLTKVGTGAQTLTGINTYTGATTISGGTLALSGAGSIAASSLLTNNGTFDITGITATGTSLTNLNGTTAGATITLGTKNLTVTNGSGSYAGSITGTGGLTVNGTGTLQLTGSGTNYVGSTTIGTGETLQGTTASLSPNSAVTANGTLAFVQANTGTFTPNVTGSGTVTVSGLTGTNAVRFNGALTNANGLVLGAGGNVVIADQVTSANTTGAVRVMGAGDRVTVNAGGGTVTSTATAGGDVAAITGAVAYSVNNGGTIQGPGIDPGSSGSHGIFAGAGLTLVNGGTINGTPAANSASTVRSNGVYVTGTADLTNNAAGTIRGGWVGTFLAGGGSLINSGTLTGNRFAGAELGGTALNGTVTNNSGGIIQSTSATDNAGVLVDGGSWTVTNAAGGTITAPGIAGIHSRFAAGLIVDNSGIVQGTGTSAYGVYASGTGAAYNVAAAANYADPNGNVYTAFITNRAGGNLVGALTGVRADGYASVTNSGLIGAGTFSGGTYTPGGMDGIRLTAGGTVTNNAGASITGASVGVLATSGTLNVTNSGTITGGAFAIRNTGAGATNVTLNAGSTTTGAIQFGTGADTLTLYNGSGMMGAATTGTIDLGAGNDTLVLRGTGTGTSAGTFTLGSVTGAETLTKLDTGTWTLTGTSTTTGLTRINAGLGGMPGNAGLLIFDGTTGLTADIYVNGGTIRSVASGGASSFGSGTIYMVDPTTQFDGTQTVANNYVLSVAPPASGNPNIFQTVNTAATVTLNGSITTSAAMGVDPAQYVTFAGVSGSRFVLGNTANAWTGPTTINAGITLQGTTATLAGAGGSVTANGTLNFVQTAAGTYGKAVNGSGLVRVSGGGAAANGGVALTGAITTAGGVHLDANSVATISNATGATTFGEVVFDGAGATLYVANGGTVAAATGGTANAVYSVQANNTIVNAGTLTSSSATYSGVFLDATTGANTVTNIGSITGYNAVFSRAALTVTNNGRLTGQTFEAVNSLGALTLSNSSSALIVGANGAVNAAAGTQISNAGTIGTGTINGSGAFVAGGTGDAINIRGGGLTNTGTINGAARGVTITGAAVTVTNTNTILGRGNDGITATSNLTVLNSGTISSNVNSGIASGGGTLTVTNAVGGTLAGGSNATFGYGLQSNTTGLTTFDNYGNATGAQGGIVSFNTGAVIANLYAGSTTGAINLGGANDTVTLFTGNNRTTALTQNYTDAVSGTTGTVTLQNAGANAAAIVGTIALGGGSNTLNLTGDGTGVGGTGAAGALNVSTVTGATTINKTGAGTFALSGTTTGGTTAVNVQGGLLTVTGGNALTDTAAVSVSTGATLGLLANERVGSLTGTGTVALGANTLTLGNGSGGGNYAGTITGTGALTIAGGTFTYGMSNIIDDAATLNVLGGATLNLNGFSDTVAVFNLNGTLTGGGTITAATYNVSGGTIGMRIGGGTLNVTGNTTITSTTAASPINIFSGATLTTSTAERLGDTSAVNIQSGGMLALGGAETIGSLADLNGTGGTVQTNGNAFTIGGANTDTTFAGTITGAGSLTKIGTGTQTLTGGSSYTGGTNVNGGTLRFQNVGTPAGAVAIGSGATLEFNIEDGDDSTISSVLLAGPTTFSGNGTILKTGNDRIALGGIGGSPVNVALGVDGLIDVQAGRFTGGTNNQSFWTNNQGSLNVAAGAFFEGVEADVIVNRLTGSGTVTGGLVQNGTLTGGLTVGAANGDATFNGTLANSDNTGNVLTLNKVGTGTQTLAGTGTYSGATNVNAGTLVASGGNAIGNRSAVTVAGGATFQITGSEIIGSLAGGGNVVLGANTLTAGGNDRSTEFAGVASGTGGLSKAGIGTLTLSGANTYTGTTTVFTGTLALGASERLADGSSLDIQDDGIFDLRDFNETVASATISGTLESTPARTGTLTAATYTLNGALVNGNLGTGTLMVQGKGVSTLNGTAAAETVNVTGTLRLGSSERLLDTAAVTVSGMPIPPFGVASGVLDIGTFTETVGTLQLTNGILNSTGGTLNATSYGLTDAVVNANLGAGTLTQQAGTSTLNGTAAAATVNVAGGMLTLGAADRLADNAAVSVASGATLDLGTFSDTVGTLALNGTLGGSGTLTATTYTLNGASVIANLGAGTLTNTGGTSTLTGTAGAGTVNVTGGTLALAAGDRLADNAAVGVASGATLNIATFNDTVGSLTLAGTLAGTGTLTAATYALNGGTANANLGAGTLTNTGGVSTLNGTSAAATVGVNAGTLTLGAADRLADAAAVTVASGATLDLGAFNDTVGTLALNGSLNGTGTLTAATYALNGGTANANLGAGTLTNTGGVSTLKGTSAAATVGVNAGTLTLGAANRLADNAAVTVASGATLNLGAFSDTVGTLALNGSLNGTGTLTAASYTLNGGTANANLGAGTLTNTGGVSTLNGTAAAATVGVNAGTLTLGAANRLADNAAVTVATGATLDLAAFSDTVGTLALNGTLGGSGTLTAATYTLNGATVNGNLGAGTLTQAGGVSTLNGTAAAATVGVNAGTLTLGAANRLADNAAVTVASGATLNLGTFSDTVGTLALNGTLNGTGTLTAASYTLNAAAVNGNLGAGTLTQAGGTSVLTGSSQAAAVNVNAGVLRLGADERLLDTGTVTIATGATLDLNGRTETIGSVNGAGTVGLGAGRLVIAGAGASGLGALTGTGTVDKTGTGTLTLANAYAATGSINTAAGSTVLTGSTAGSLRVTGGTLSGTGSAAGTLTLTGGTVAPGAGTSPFGTLTVGGFAASGGAYALDFGGAAFGFQSDLIRVNGAAALSGTVAVTANAFTGNEVFQRTYTVLQANSLTGTFANLNTFTQSTADPALFYRLRYDLQPNAVVLQVQRQIDFAAAVPGGTPNQLAVARALTGGAGQASDAFAATLNAIAASGGDRGATYDSLSGEAIADVTTGALFASDRFVDLLHARMGLRGDGAAGGAQYALRAGMTDGQRRASGFAGAMQDGVNASGGTASSSGGGVWLQGYGAGRRLRGLAGQARTNSFVSGLAGGLDGRFGPVSAGIAGGFSELDTRVQARNSQVDGTLYQGGAYVAYDNGSFYGQVAGSYYGGDVTVTRRLTIGGTVAGQAIGTTDVHGYSIGGVLGARFEVGGGTRAGIELAGQQTQATRRAYTETAPLGLGLTAARDSRDVFTGTAQLKLSHLFTGNGWTAEPFASGGVQVNSGDLATVNAMQFGAAPTGTGGFLVQGARLESTLGVFTGGIEIRPSDSFRIDLSAGGAIGNRTREGQIKVSARVAF